MRDGKEKKLKATLEKMKEEELQPASDEPPTATGASTCR
jgi:hypothetical protein